MQTLRPIRPADDPVVASIIRDVMTELGASGPGFAIHDTEVDAMSAAYAGPGAVYLVVEDGDAGVLGGAGIAPLEGGDGVTCELRKMYFRPSLRGTGAGQRLLWTLLRAAAALGYSTCYLETLASMAAARRLYERVGFVRRAGPLGATGHYGCDAWYERDLAGLDLEGPALPLESLDTALKAPPLLTGEGAGVGGGPLE
jgi:putative acetyltransferase